MRFAAIAVLLAGMFCATQAGAAQLTSRPVAVAPTVDGRSDDPGWVQAQAVSVRDAVADIPLSLKSVHHDGVIYFLVSFPDADESRVHRELYWDASSQRYLESSEREDVFVFKWNMSPYAVDLRLHGERDYLADIWFWKAQRTDPLGYADDKMQSYTSFRVARDASPLRSDSGRLFYLTRRGDNGRAAYASEFYPQQRAPRMPRYRLQQPQGSRADVRAKGKWMNGYWYIEFARQLQTGQEDDLQFEPGARYSFGVSRYELAGRAPDASLAQPDYGAGDVGELITLFISEGAP